MVTLGIDYGKKKVGLAISESKIARPVKVVRYLKTSELLQKLDRFIQQEAVGEIVLGLSEGSMGEETKRFGKLLQSKFELTVHYEDETLSTKEAQELSIAAGIKRSKRKALEDAYSAAIILQAYIDSNN